MDVTKLNVDGEWLELETTCEEFGALRVRVVPRQFSGTLSMVLNDDVIRLVSHLVVDWNLENKGKKVPCNSENKEKYLPIIAGWKINNPKHAKKGAIFENVGTEIIAFAQDIKNFVKN